MKFVKRKPNSGDIPSTEYKEGQGGDIGRWGGVGWGTQKTFASTNETIASIIDFNVERTANEVEGVRTLDV